MQHFLGSLSSGWSGARQPNNKAPAPLQTVQEQAEHESRWALPPQSPIPTWAALSSSSHFPGGYKPEPGGLGFKPNSDISRRPLGRTARKDPGHGDDHGNAQHHAAAADAAKRAVYMQEGDVEPNEFKETVAELLKEEEYGVLRLVVPHIVLPRQQFDRYVRLLSSRRQQRQQRLGAAGGAAKAGSPRPRSIWGLPVVPPYSPLSLLWMSLMTAVDLTWTAFGVPINVAFCSVDYGHAKSACTATDVAFGVVYAANLLISFNLGVMVVNGHRKKAVLDGRRLARYYIMYGRFLLDLAATVPLVYLVAVLALSRGRGYRSKWVNALSLIRLIRLLRLVNVSKVIYIDSALGPDGWLSRYLNVATLHVLLVTYQVALLVNLVACLLVLLAHMRGLDRSWMTAISWTDLPDAHPAYQWYCAMYWVITSMTTTGFGDFSPRWWAEQVLISMAMVGGLIAFGVLVASVANALARKDTAANRLQTHIKKISQVNHWLGACGLSPAAKLRIQEYFAQVFVSKQSLQYGEPELFTDLPPYLRFEVASELALPLVRQVHGLRQLNSAAQQLLASHLRPVRAIVGQQLCRQGDEADRLWLLSSGRLAALRHKEGVQLVGAPALVGEGTALALDIPQCRYRPWSLRAALPCELWELRLGDLARVVTIYPALRLSLLEHLRGEMVRTLFDMASGAAPTPPPGPAPPPPPAPPGDASQSALAVEPDWCELAALLRGALQGLQAALAGAEAAAGGRGGGAASAALDELCIQLQRANIEDGSLQALLSEMVEGAMVRDGLTSEAVMGLPLIVQQHAAQQHAAQQHVVQQQQQQQQQQHGGSSHHRPASGRPPSPSAGLHPHPHSHLQPPRGSSPRPRSPSPLSAGAYDPHRGPAPWGLATEDALAAAASVGATGSGGGGAATAASPALPLHQASAPHLQSEPHPQQPQPPPPLPQLAPSLLSYMSAHARRDGLLPLPPVAPGGGRWGPASPSLPRSESAVLEHRSLAPLMPPPLAGTASAPMPPLAGTASAPMPPPPATAELPPSDSPSESARAPEPTAPAVAAKSGGGAGTCVDLGPRKDDLVEEVDPIAAETGVAPPRTQQPSYQKQGSGRPAAGGGDRMPPGGISGPSAVVRTLTGGGGDGGSPTLAGGMTAAGRRSLLSRVSSPFVTAYGAALQDTGGGGEHTSQPQPQQQQSCSYCGSAPCPVCGVRLPSSSGPYPPPGGAAAALSRRSSSGHHAPSPPPAMSLIDAIRGGMQNRTAGGGGATAAAPLLGMTAAAAAPRLPSLAAMSLENPVAAAALSRRSRMYGRSFAATARMDTLVRTTLRRETTTAAGGGWLSQRDEDEGYVGFGPQHSSSVQGGASSST